MASLRLRLLLVFVLAGAALALMFAPDSNATPDPYMPIPPIWCPGGGIQTGWGGYCDGRPYPDGTKWHQDSVWAPFVGQIWRPIVCVIDGTPAPPPLAGPGGCGGAA